MQYDNTIDNMTEAQAKDFIDWLLLKHGCQLILEDAYDLASKNIDKMVITYKIDNGTKYNPIIIRDGHNFIGYVSWIRYHASYTYRNVLKQLFSGYDIYLFLDSTPIISKNDSISTFLVEYDLQSCMRQQLKHQIVVSRIDIR